MPEPKAQLIDPQGPIDVPGMQVTGVTTATGGFVGNVQGAATGLASTTANLSVGIVTATKFQGNTTGNVSGLADDTNINVGIITSTSFTGDLVGNAAGLSTTTANINAGIMSATSFAGNFTGVASGITGTPNIVVGIMTGTLKGDGSSLTGIAATNWITNNVTANSSTTTVDLDLGNVVKFTQSADTTVSFANTGTSNIVTFVRLKDGTSTARALTWPDSIKWNGGSAPTLVTNFHSGDANVITLLTRDEGVTWYGWESVNKDITAVELWAAGHNTYGTLGQNNRTSYSSPVQISGTSWSYGNTQGFRAEENIMMFKTDGTLWVWGNNGYGELGLNDIAARSSPVQLPGTTWNYAICSRATLASKSDGTLWSWGENNNGRLGQNEASPGNHKSSPVQLPGTWGIDSRNKMTTGTGGASFAIKSDGTLWAWGRGNDGSLGLNQEDVYRSSPTQIPGTTWSSITTASYGALGLKTDGTAWMWGKNEYGELGQNNKTKYSSPVQIPGTTWKEARYSGTFSIGVKTDGTMWTWGRNQWQGQLGQNDTTWRSSPVQVPGTNWDKLAASVYSGGGIKDDGTLWRWGGNTYGQLAQNTTGNTYYSSPVQIPGTAWISTSMFGQSAIMVKEVR